MPRKKKRPRAEDAPAGGGGGSAGSSVARPDLPINAVFAARYEAQKRRELLASVPAELLAGDGGESSSDDEEEDELGELLTKRMDRGIAATLEALRKKDPRIYEKDVKFFEDVEEGDGEEGSGEEDGSEVDSDDEPVAGWDAIAEAARAKESSKVTLKDYVRENLLRDGRLSDSEDEGEREVEGEGGGGGGGAGSGQHVSFAVDKGRAEASSGVVDDDGGEDEEEGEDGDDYDDDDNDEDEDDGDFFRKKEKTQRELQEEERDFERFLTKQAVKAAPKAGDDLLLHSYLERETTDEKEMFLRDFVLNNGWLARGSSAAPKVDDYKIEVDKTNVSKKLDDREGEGHGIASGEEGSPGGGDVDSDFDDKLDEFEHRYNFRFEEPGGTEVVSHARTIDGSMRRPDDRRKAVREARKKRKQHEKLVKTEEIKHLKNVKKREIEARLVALQDAAGDGANFAGFDLDAEFDPDEFNRQMESRFGDEYYEQQDAEMMMLQDEDVVVASEARLKPKLPKSDSEDGDDNRDAPLREEVERLMDEYYSLDYEDIIGGTPVRFKYKKVDKETFDMDPAEILVADDKELNRAVSLKYLAPYRSKSSIPKRVVKQAKRARFGAAAGADDVARRGRLRQHDDKDASKEKDRSRKKREKRKSRECDASGETTERDGDESEEKPERKKKKRKAEDSTAPSVKAETGDNDSPTKKKKKSKGEKKKHRKERSDHAAAVMPASRRAAYGL